MIFSSETSILNSLKDSAIYCGSAEQDVLCINERQVMVRSKVMYNDNFSQADIMKRPMTSYVG